MSFALFKRISYKTVLAVAALLAAVALVTAACSDDDSNAGAQTDDLESIQASIDEIQTSLQRTEVVAAMGFLSGVGFHAIDDEMQAAEEIPGGVPGRISNAHAVASSTNWPADLQELADALVASLADFDAALEAEDLQASKGFATDAHNAYHDLEHDAFAFISGESHGEGDGHGEEGEDDHGGEEEGEGDDHGDEGEESEG